MAIDRPEDILRLWHALELLSPQRPPKIDPDDGVYQGVHEGLLPWDAHHPAIRQPLREHYTWRHTVFLGLYDIEGVSKHLAEVFRGPDEAYQRRTPGTSALACFSVTAEGTAVPGSLVIATCPWAVGVLDPERPDAAAELWLDGYEPAARQLQADFMLRVPVQSAEADLHSESDKRINAHSLTDLTGWLAEQLRVDAVLQPASWRTRTRQVHAKYADAGDDTDFVNSFLLDDLEAVRRSLPMAGQALRTYLRVPSPNGVRERVDVRQAIDAVDERLRPGVVPSGRWPQDPDRALSTSQQFAVATALNEVADSTDIFAVNGPPGTGKTTMLRDLLAALVTRRAEALADLAHPEHAFLEQKWPLKNEGYPYVVRALHPSLVGYEMVLASTNNSAVENVSLEIPARQAATWPERCAYLPELAQQVLDATNGGRRGSIPAWGLLAARLGNAGNRQQFLTAFWFGEKKKTHRKGEGEEPRPGLREVLRSYERTSRREDWNAARERFRLAQAEVERFRGDRVRHLRTANQLGEVEQQLQENTRQLDAAALRLRDAVTHQARAQDEQREAHELAELRAAALHMHDAGKPGWWANVLSWGRERRNWSREGEPLRRAATMAYGGEADAVAVLQEANHDVRRNRSEVEALQTEAQALRSRCEELRANLGPMSVALGRHDPTMRGARSERDRELDAAWLDPAWNSARTSLFLAALDLHETWVRTAGPTLRHNLSAAMEVLGGAAPKQGHEQAVAAAWQTFFLVVPMVSTTFASVARMFTGMSAQTLGWLLVDEAGQATPQSVVGALWRSKRAVVVGDPQQVEPVVTVPYVAQAKLRARFGVDERWLPARASVQTLADQLCPYGTHLPPVGEADPMWVGSPLLAHRRCDEPMFGICNDIAYDGMMIQAVDREEIDLPPSFWRDVTGPAVGHWRPEQGRAARELVEELVSRWGLRPRDIFVISPFRDVARKLNGLFGKSGVEVATVHTAQGREAEVVVLVLGGDPDRPRAKSFATEKPNLLNVAVSRARRRVYVIGSRSDWGQARFFDRLAQLPEPQDLSSVITLPDRSTASAQLPW